MKQPPDAARQQVIDWIQATWTSEARKHDGDPGVGAGAAAEQRRIRLHHPRPDGRRHPSGAGISRSIPPIRPDSTTPASR